MKRLGSPPFLGWGIGKKKKKNWGPPLFESSRFWGENFNFWGGAQEKNPKTLG